MTDITASGVRYLPHLGIIQVEPAHAQIGGGRAGKASTGLRTKTEVCYRVNVGAESGCFVAEFTDDPGVPKGISCRSAEAALADLNQNAALLNERNARALRPADPVQDLMNATAVLTSVASQLGWRHKQAPVITPGGDVQMTLKRRRAERHPGDLSTAADEE